ncbi:MAG: pentapeptide repeat-containing protein, partial [Vicinamibacterales bacterium]
LDRLEGAEVNISTLYQVFTDAWVHRDSWRETLTPNAKRDFVTALAIGLWRSGLERLHYTELESYVRSHLAPHIHTPQQFAEIDNEVRTATFVTRDDAGNYGFAHKSYGEFFLSRHLATELLQGRTECLAGPRLSQEIAEFIRWLVNTDTERLLEQVLVGPYSVNVSENALHTLYYCRRSAALADARGGGAERAALRIPLPNSIQLNGARLEGAVLEGASLVGANCENAFLQGAVLSGVDLSRGHLRGANLSTTELSRARVDAADISGANCSGIQLGGASAVEADFTSADLTDSFLQGLIWTGAQFLSALVGGASADPDLEAEFERLGLIRRDFPLERGPESPDFWTAISELHPRIRRAARARAPFKGIDAEDLASQVILQMAAPAVQRRFVAVSSTERWAMIATALSRLSSTVFQEEEGRRRRVGAIEVDGINYVGEEVFDVETDDASGEERVLLREFRETLSPEAWRLLSGRYFEGYTINELAALYELTPKYVSRQLKKCGDLLLNWLAAPPPKPGS